MAIGLFKSHTSTKFVQLDTGSCRACWKCVDACHKNVIGKIDFLGHRHARVDTPELCTGCEKCVRVCESGAFSKIQQPSGGKAVESQEPKKPFNRRAFVSVAMFMSGLVLPISGIMNHSLGFELLSAERHFWMSVHNMSAALFTVFAIWHVTLNWKALLHYAEKVKGVTLSKEAVAAIVLVCTIVGIFASHAFHVR